MRTQNFAEWMSTKVKSIHYANNEAMIKAFNKFKNPNLKVHNYQFK